MAPGPLPSLWRRHRLLGARGDRQGRVRHPRVGHACGGGAKLERALPRTRAPLAWLRRAWRRSSARVASRRRRTSRSTRGAVCSSVGRRAGDRARVRGPALGGPGAARVPRAPGRVGARRPDAASLHRPARAVRAERDVRRPGSERTADQSRPVVRRGDGATICALLERAVLPGGDAADAARAAGGNPLYAEEFVRLLSDRGRLGRGRGGAGVGAGIIAARLDTLPAERKSLLQDAAVHRQGVLVGRARAMGDRDPREVEQALHELARKELVRPSRSSAMEGEAEYGFWHVLVQDVCYAQIPRAARAAVIRRPLRGSRRRRASARKTSPTCSRTTTRPRLELNRGGRLDERARAAAGACRALPGPGR